MKNRVFTLCFTGISGSGKSTLAKELDRRLAVYGISIQLMDGDVVRKELGNLFGYTKEERMKQSKVVRLLAKYLNENRISTIVTMVAAYEEMRDSLREFLGEAYIQIYTKCSYEECAARDVKGYYKKQRLGQMENLNGADDVFEEPMNSEIVVDTEHDTTEMCVSQILRYLEVNGYVSSIQK